MYSCMLGSKPWTPVAVPFSYSRNIPRQVVESRVESVLWQENGRVHWWRKHIVISLIRGCQLTIHEELQVHYLVENCAASIDYCRTPSAIVCDMQTKFAT